MSDPTPAPGPLRRALEQPLFFVAILLLLLGTPWFLATLRMQQGEIANAGAVDRWQQELERAGLPAPFLDPVDVAPPADLTDAEAAKLGGVVREHYDLLVCWRETRAGSPKLPPKAKTIPGRMLSATLDACYALHAAAQGRTEALEDAASSAELAVPHWRPTLEVVIDLLAGRDASRASQMLSDPDLPPACRAPLEAVVRELKRRAAPAGPPAAD